MPPISHNPFDVLQTAPEDLCQVDTVAIDATPASNVTRVSAATVDTVVALSDRSDIKSVSSQLDDGVTLQTGHHSVCPAPTAYSSLPIRFPAFEVVLESDK